MQYEFYQNHYSLKDLLEAGVHFGHSTKRWNPKTGPFIYGTKRGVHIIDLRKTVPLLEKGLKAIKETAAQNGRILFVSTKKQAEESIQESAIKCGQPYVNARWLGGTLTNWHTVSASIKTLRDYEAALNNPKSTLTKKERLYLSRKYDKLNTVLGGIRNMGGLPDMIFLIDVPRHKIAVKEANRLGIPIVGIVDSNADPSIVQYPIPGNDDGLNAIKLYCDLAAKAVLAGIQESLHRSGVDTGEAANPTATPAAPKAPEAQA